MFAKETIGENLKRCQGFSYQLRERLVAKVNRTNKRDERLPSHLLSCFPATFYHSRFFCFPFRQAKLNLTRSDLVSLLRFVKYDQLQKIYVPNLITNLFEWDLVIETMTKGEAFEMIKMRFGLGKRRAEQLLA